MSGYHADIAPSSLDRTVACNAWHRMAEGLPPEPDKPETLEGNAADWVAKQYAQGKEIAYGAATPVKGYTVDYDMIHGAKLWADVVGYGANSGVPVIIERVHPSKCWGEPDGWKLDGIEQILHVPDYKYGFEVIEVFENWQLMAYAAGLLKMLELDDQVVRIHFTIVQPRAFHKLGPVRSWTVRADEIRAHVNIMATAAARALQRAPFPEPEARAGAHCMTTHCPARHVCPTLQRAAAAVAEWSREGETAHAMTAEGIGTELTILTAASEVIEARRSGLAAQAEAMLRNGTRIPGFKMEAGGAPLKWNANVTVDEVVGLGKLANPPKDMTKPPAEPNSRNSNVITPTQAIKAGVSKALVEVYASPTPTAMKLVPDDGTEARRAFGPI